MLGIVSGEKEGDGSLEDMNEVLIIKAWHDASTYPINADCVFA